MPSLIVYSADRTFSCSGLEVTRLGKRKRAQRQPIPFNESHYRNSTPPGPFCDCITGRDDILMRIAALYCTLCIHFRTRRTISRVCALLLITGSVIDLLRQPKFSASRHFLFHWWWRDAWMWWAQSSPASMPWNPTSLQWQGQVAICAGILVGLLQPTALVWSSPCRYLVMGTWHAYHEIIMKKSLSPLNYRQNNGAMLWWGLSLNAEVFLS